MSVDELRRLLIDPQAEPLDIGLALHAMTPDDPETTGSGLSRCVRAAQPVSRHGAEHGTLTA